MLDALRADEALVSVRRPNPRHATPTAAAKIVGRKTFSGLEALTAFLQMPEDFPDKATIAEIPGKVTKVTPAEQGGHYVHVGDREHYIAHGMEVLVKPGDTVEAGDALGDGIVSPADVVRHRGLGEGRRYYADRLKTILDDSGQAANRRNTEVLARGAMNHVEIGDDDVGNHLPGSLTTYDSLMRDYHAPASARVTAVKSAEAATFMPPSCTTRSARS